VPIPCEVEAGGDGTVLLEVESGGGGIELVGGS
jgi:hypothetical protein